ncbi:MAG: hypothetical protein ACRC33_25855, partial [Gemmataceae bacterium]
MQADTATVDDIAVTALAVALPCETRTHPRFERPLETTVRSATLLSAAPWVRSLGQTGLHVTTQGWRFPLPPDQPV